MSQFPRAPAGEAQATGCPLCEADGGLLVARLPSCRVIRALEPGFPAFYRVVLQAHVAEWTDLDEPAQWAVMRTVNTVERCLRELLSPTKINLAALGNVVPHLHWHVIARFDWDSHFPAPVWSQALRDAAPHHLAALDARLAEVDSLIARRLQPDPAP